MRYIDLDKEREQRAVQILESLAVMASMKFTLRDCRKQLPYTPGDIGSWVANLPPEDRLALRSLTSKSISGYRLDYIR